MTDTDFSVAVFPFLKTSAPVRIGEYLFRSTSDLGELPNPQAEAVAELEQMLFAQNDLRVKSASFAILPPIEVHSGDQRLVRLANLRDIVSYFYAQPHETMGHVFLGPEETSLVLFSPSPVTVFLTRPKHHTISVNQVSASEPDPHHYVRGYNGLYNFRHAFWVEPGARLYGPKPHIVSNISQDLHADFEYRLPRRPDYGLLLRLLEKPEAPTSLRIFSALRWFNVANEHGSDQSRSILNLAIAFETLLRLPESSKTDRLVDAISLLLGRTERIDEWAGQFYAARSSVVHEGEVRDVYFYASGTKQRQISDIFGSLMLYGRQIFQLCVGAVLFGANLAERADLQEKLVSNNERYQKICSLLDAGRETPSASLLSLSDVVQALQRYRFVPHNVEAGPMIAAVRLACVTLVDCNQDLPETLAAAVLQCADARREESEFKRLSTIEVLNSVFEKIELSTLTTEGRIVRDLVDLVWMSLFQRYYWLRDREQGRAK